MFTILLLATLLPQVLSQTNNPHTTALPETGGGAIASAGDLAALPACAVSLVYSRPPSSANMT